MEKPVVTKKRPKQQISSELVSGGAGRWRSKWAMNNEAEEEAAEGGDVRLDLVAVLRLGQQHAREERAFGQRLREGIREGVRERARGSPARTAPRVSDRPSACVKADIESTVSSVIARKAVWSRAWQRQQWQVRGRRRRGERA